MIIEMEIYSGVNDRPCCLIRFPDGASDEQIAAFEQRYLAAHKIRPLPTPIDLSWVVWCTFAGSDDVSVTHWAPIEYPEAPAEDH